YTKAFGDGPRNSKPWSVTWTTPERHPLSLTTTPHQRKDVSALDGFNVHRCPYTAYLWWYWNRTPEMPAMVGYL
ncbi:hypothetical protein TNCV_5052631, partial [Trichonephila clavipes]